MMRKGTRTELCPGDWLCASRSLRRTGPEDCAPRWNWLRCHRAPGPSKQSQKQQQHQVDPESPERYLCLGDGVSRLSWMVDVSLHPSSSSSSSSPGAERAATENESNVGLGNCVVPDLGGCCSTHHRSTHPCSQRPSEALQQDSSISYPNRPTIGGLKLLFCTTELKRLW